MPDLPRLSLSLGLLFLLAPATDALLPQRGGGSSPSSGTAPQVARSTQLAGRSLDTYPHFEFVTSFHEGEPVEFALEASRYPELVGRTVEVYVVAHRSDRDWRKEPQLIDVSGGPRSFTLDTSGIVFNRHLLDGGTLSGDAGIDIGVPYDVVIDCDRNGFLDPDDYLDGGDPEAGFYVVHDLEERGPLAVTEIIYSGGAFLGQDLYYPAEIRFMGKRPLVVVSHGNGHNYRWYDHIGNHLASYGFIVMSHTNRTQPGIEAASLTTRTNTDYFLSNLDTIAGGVLEGRVDSNNITWIGHSRGGEGVVRAYRLLRDGADSYDSYSWEDIKLISSMAPTDFLGAVDSNVGDATYHLWTAGADADVNGCANCNICQTFHLHDRAERARYSISLHGVGHGDLHAQPGSSVASGPCLLGRGRTHSIMRGYLLALVKYVIEGQVAGRDYLWRQWESFKPPGATKSECAVVDLMYRRDPADSYVLDDFQTEEGPETSSSGGAVVYDVLSLSEAKLDDGNNNFTDDIADPMNGMTMARNADSSRGVVFEFDGVGDYSYMLQVSEDAPAFSDYAFLSFRAAQATRHPYTTIVLEDLTFSVRLWDAEGRQSTIQIGAYGGGIEEPYQRGGCGAGFGWGNEFESIRIRLTDFQHEKTLLDLERIAAVEFLFGPSYGSAEGRIGLDDIALEHE